MQPQHDAYCDEQHLPRQQCNDALAPADLQAATPTESEPAEAAEPIIEPAPDEESVSSAIRKGVATAGALEPAAYASRETAPVHTVEWRRHASRCDGRRGNRGGVGDGAWRAGAAWGAGVRVVCNG